MRIHCVPFAHYATWPPVFSVNRAEPARLLVVEIEQALPGSAHPSRRPLMSGSRIPYLARDMLHSSVVARFRQQRHIRLAKCERVH